MHENRRYGLGAGRAAAVVLACGLLAGTPRAARADGTGTSLKEGVTIHLTRDVVLNGVNLARGSNLVIAKVKKDEAGKTVRVDLAEPGGEKRVFKAITPDAVQAMTATSGSGGGAGGGTGGSVDRNAMFKVAAQIPLMRDVTLGGTELSRGTVLQIDRVYKDKEGKVVKVDVRETAGKKRLLRSLTVEEIAYALVPDDVTWPDGAVGRPVTLGNDLSFAGESVAKGTKLVVTRVITDKNGGIVKVDLRETDGKKREFAEVPVAVLKQNGALGAAAGAPR